MFLVVCSGGSSGIGDAVRLVGEVAQLLLFYIDQQPVRIADQGVLFASADSNNQIKNKTVLIYQHIFIP